MPNWAWMLLLIVVVAVMLLANGYERSQRRERLNLMVEQTRQVTLMTLFRQVRAHGTRYQIDLVEWPNGGWRWSIWDADAALAEARPVREGTVGIETPYASGNAPTRPDAEAQALAEVAGLRLQERVDEVFVA